jgi:hypothetical protein
MVAAVVIQSPNYDDDNFTPVFNRSRKEFYLTLKNDVRQEMMKVNNSLMAVQYGKSGSHFFFG